MLFQSNVETCKSRRLKSQRPSLCYGVGLEEEGGEDEGDRREEFDEDVERGAGGVFEGVAYGVTYYGGFVGVGFFAAVLAGFDPLLGVVPGAAAVVHEHGHEDAGDGADHEETGYGGGSAEVYRDAVDGGDGGEAAVGEDFEVHS